MGGCEGLRLVGGGGLGVGDVRAGKTVGCRGGPIGGELGRKGREGEAGGKRGRRKALSALDYRKKLRIEMRWSEGWSAVAFRCETWRTKCAPGVLAIRSKST